MSERFEELAALLADPAVIGDQPRFRDLSMEYARLDPVVRDKRGTVWKERRVLVLKYRRYGDEYNRPSDPISFVSRSEEVEGEPVKLYGGKD